MDELVRISMNDDFALVKEWIESVALDCDLRMSDVSEGDITSALGNGESGSVPEDRTGFAALDREILAILSVSGGNQSTKTDTWSRRRFDEWRLQNGMLTSVSVETMDLKDLAEQLPIFFRQVVKHNGEHYPLESLVGFYRGFTRIMQKAQGARVIETLVIETPFCMRSQPLFQQTGVAFLEAMRRSVLAGANKRRKKPAVFSWPNEQAMLSDKDHQASHPYGCFRRWLYYCISRFMVRSGKELFNMVDYDFEEQKDENGDCIVYGERLSKNNDSSTVTMPVMATAIKATRTPTKRTKVELPCVPVKCYQGDVIHTYRQFMKHQPVKVGEEVGKPRHLFLQPIGNPVTNAWFAKCHVSERVLISIFKMMAVVAGVSMKDISKTLTRPTITGSSTEDISRICGVRSSVTTGISSNGCFDRCESTVDPQVDHGQSSINKVLDSTASKRNFQEAFGETSRKVDEAQQISPGASSVKCVELAGTDPDQESNVAVSGAVMVASEVVTTSDKQCSADLDNIALGEVVFTKLESARTQLRDLESTLFEKINLKGQNLHDQVQVAVLQLKELEATLSSMLS